MRDRIEIYNLHGEHGVERKVRILFDEAGGIVGLFTRGSVAERYLEAERLMRAGEELDEELEDLYWSVRKPWI